MALIVPMFVPIVLDIGETLQYLFAEREESKDDFVCEYILGVCNIHVYCVCIHFITATCADIV